MNGYFPDDPVVVLSRTHGCRGSRTGGGTSRASPQPAEQLRDDTAAILSELVQISSLSVQEPEVNAALIIDFGIARIMEFAEDAEDATVTGWERLFST